MLKCLIQLHFLSLLFYNVEASRILAVIENAAYSHQSFFQPIWRELAIRGHDIVVITTDPTNETLQNFREISIRESCTVKHEMNKIAMTTGVLQRLIQGTLCEHVMRLGSSQFNAEVLELINNKDEHFDLIFIEHNISPWFGIKHRFKCPLIGVNSIDAIFRSHGIMGNAVHFILYPIFFVPLNENPTFFERLSSVAVHNVLKLKKPCWDDINQLSRNAFGNDTPLISELMESTDMLFINANPVFNAIRPLTPSTISIAGGLHIKPAKALPQNIKSFLDNSKQGAVYFNLGSTVKCNELPLKLRKIFLDTFSQLPYNILWKFEDDNLPGKPKNVLTVKWAPQQDVLRHKNVKLFITQGGLQSLEEALYTHVPVVIIPIFADQNANAKKATEKGIGVSMDQHTMTVDSLTSAILEVIHNHTYKDTMKRFATQIQDAPMTPLERAIWWTEYVLRHKGAQHLKGPRIPAYQYYYVDVLAFIGVCSIIILFIVFRIMKCIFCSAKVKLSTSNQFLRNKLKLQ